MKNIDSLLLKVNEQIINPLIILMFALATLYFVWGVVDFIQHPEEAEKGRNHIMYGIIGMFIMVSVFGIMRFITSTLGLDSSVIPR